MVFFYLTGFFSICKISFNSNLSVFVFVCCGLKFEEESSEAKNTLGKVVEVVLAMRVKAKEEKNFQLSDEIRNKLTDAGIKIKDSKEGSNWSL